MVEQLGGRVDRRRLGGQQVMMWSWGWCRCKVMESCRRVLRMVVTCGGGRSQDNCVAGVCHYGGRRDETAVDRQGICG